MITYPQGYYRAPEPPAPTTFKMVVVLVALVMCLLASQAFPQTPVNAVDVTTGKQVRFGDLTNGALRIVCILGTCTGAGGGGIVQLQARDALGTWTDVGQAVGNTQIPILAAALPLPTGASTSALQTLGNLSLTSLDSKLLLPAALAGGGGLKVECLSGCGAAAAFADASAFTFGTTGIGVVGFVVDDVGTNTVAENSAGTPRMSTNRVMYVDLAKTGANATAILVTGSGGTFPVTNAGLTNLDVALSTRLKPADTLTKVTTVDTITNAVTVTDGAGALNVIVDSGAVTNTPPADQTINLNKVAGTATDVNSGTKSAGTLRVILATDQPQLTNKLLVTPDSVALPANQSVNVAQLAGTATDTNSGTKSAGTLRVVLATDQPALTNKLLVTPDSVALPANQSVNLAQIAGSNILTAATGSQKVGITGNTGAAVDAANNAAAPANEVIQGDELQSGAQSTAGTAGQVGRVVAGLDHVQYARLGGPVYWHCGLTAIAATLTQCKAAPAAGLKAYVTDITVVSDTATAGQFTLRYGTGSNCATGVTTLFPDVAATTAGKIPYPANTAAQPTNYAFLTPLQPAAANAVCVICIATQTCTISMQGYEAP